MKESRCTYLVRLVRIDDADQYFRLVSGNRHQMGVFFTQTLKGTETLADTLVYLATRIRQAEKGMQYLFVIEAFEQGLIGSIEVLDIDLSGLFGEIGFFIEEFDRHRPVLIRSLNSVTDFCFSYCRLMRLLFRTSAIDIRARQAAEENGFILSVATMSEAKTFLSPEESVAQYYLIKAIHQ